MTATAVSHRIVGTCRQCSRRVRNDEGHMIRGRWEHHDCATAIARMDAARAAKGKTPVAGRPTRSTDHHHGAVRIIDTTTGEVRYDAPLSTRDVERIVDNANRQPRAWDERQSSHGGGHH